MCSEKRGNWAVRERLVVGEEDSRELRVGGGIDERMDGRCGLSWRVLRDEDRKRDLGE